MSCGELKILIAKSKPIYITDIVFLFEKVILVGSSQVFMVCVFTCV